jgi:hypothetical protein
MLCVSPPCTGQLVLVVHVNGNGGEEWEMLHQAMMFDDNSTSWILIGFWILINLVLGLFGFAT